MKRIKLKNILLEQNSPPDLDAKWTKERIQKEKPVVKGLSKFKDKNVDYDEYQVIDFLKLGRVSSIGGDIQAGEYTYRLSPVGKRYSKGNIIYQVIRDYITTELNRKAGGGTSQTGIKSKKVYTPKPQYWYAPNYQSAEELNADDGSQVSNVNEYVNLAWQGEDLNFQPTPRVIQADNGYSFIAGIGKGLGFDDLSADPKVFKKLGTPQELDNKIYKVQPVKIINEGENNPGKALFPALIRLGKPVLVNISNGICTIDQNSLTDQLQSDAKLTNPNWKGSIKDKIEELLDDVRRHAANGISDTYTDWLNYFKRYYPTRWEMTNVGLRRQWVFNIGSSKAAAKAFTGALSALSGDFQMTAYDKEGGRAIRKGRTIIYNGRSVPSERIAANNGMLLLFQGNGKNYISFFAGANLIFTELS